MSLWRLEWLRLVRTRRLALVVVVYLFFGIVGPLTARYLGEIVDRFGGGEVDVRFPPPLPVDGLQQFNANAQQVGLLVAVFVAAGALTVHALPEMAVFLRTRVSDPARLLPPRVVMTFLAVSAAYLAGVAVAGYETWALLGSLPWDRVALGAALGVVYLAVVVALTAAVGSRSPSVSVTVAATVVALLGLPVLGLVDAVDRWLPSRLVGALDGLVRGDPVGDYLPAVAVSAVTVVLLLAAATLGVRRHEL